MTPDEFYALYDSRVRAYSRRVAKRYKVPSHLIPDLRNAAYIAITLGLPSWHPEGGKSAFNYCCRQMLRHMEAEIRKHHGNKPMVWRREIHYYQEPIGDREFGEDSYKHVDAKIDLARILNADRHPLQIARLYRRAMDPYSTQDYAEGDGRSRQAINSSIRHAIKRLRKSCQEYKQ